jgi:NitT/TauT family transport system substrate-binding protein
MSNIKAVFVSIIFLVTVLVSACQPAAQSPSVSPATATAPKTEPVMLRLALLPILDALPIYVAQEEGYFQEAGINVQFIPANSANERDQIMAAGQADGIINDLVSVMLYDRDQVQIQVVCFAQVATKENPMFRIVTSAQSGIQSVADLKDVEIGISQSSVIEYVTDRLLESEGIPDNQIQTIAVPKIPDRLALLANNGLKAATLPEPFSSQAMLDGGIDILDDSSHPQYGNSVISFRKSVIDSDPQAVKAFLEAVQKAVSAINANPQGWSAVLSKYNLLPDALLASYVIPPYPAAAVPTKAQFDDVVSWVMDKQLITNPVSYTDAVNSSLLP